MRIVHDESRCASLGICESIAPTVFEVGEDGVLTLRDPVPDEQLRPLVEEAVAACPTGALRVEP
jgi:ferredoxin